MARVNYGLLLLLLFLPAAGCAAGTDRVVKAGGQGGEKTVEMNASNFDFDPAVIQASPGDVLTLRIRNLSGTDHNFTIADPGGQILHSLDLPGKSTKEITIALPAAGVYPYHCDKPFHPTMGMKGRIEVQ